MKRNWTAVCTFINRERIFFSAKCKTNQINTDITLTNKAFSTLYCYVVKTHCVGGKLVMTTTTTSLERRQWLPVWDNNNRYSQGPGNLSGKYKWVHLFVYSCVCTFEQLVMTWKVCMCRCTYFYDQNEIKGLTVETFSCSWVLNHKMNLFAFHLSTSLRTHSIVYEFHKRARILPSCVYFRMHHLSTVVLVNIKRRSGSVKTWKI